MVARNSLLRLGTVLGEKSFQDKSSYQSRSLRITYGIWILSSLVLTSSYAGNLKAYLTNPTYSQPINNLNEVSQYWISNKNSKAIYTSYNIEKCKKYEIRFKGKTTLFRRDFQIFISLATQNLAVLCVKTPWNGFRFSWNFWCCMRYSVSGRKMKTNYRTKWVVRNWTLTCNVSLRNIYPEKHAIFLHSFWNTVKPLIMSPL